MSDVAGSSKEQVPDHDLAGYIDEYQPGCTLHRLLVELRERRAAHEPKVHRDDCESVLLKGDPMASCNCEEQAQRAAQPPEVIVVERKFTDAEIAALDGQPPAPRFTVNVRDGIVSVYDDDFGFDAALRVTGDFVDDEKKRFAQAVADVLNANVERIPTADSMRGGKA